MPKTLVAFLFLLPLLISCSEEHEPSAVISLINNDTIRFVGKTHEDSFQEFLKILEDKSHAITTLVIESGGGDIDFGMRMGELIQKHEIHVIVEKICASSCANYIATAGKTTTITKGAVIGWHGGISQEIYIEATSDSPSIDNQWLEMHRQRVIKGMGDQKEFYEAAVKSSLDNILKELPRERAYFNSIGVNQAVTILGLMPSYQFQRSASLFSFDQATLKALGMTNFIFEDEQQSVAIEGKRISQIFTIEPENLKLLLAQHEKT